MSPPHSIRARPNISSWGIVDSRRWRHASLRMRGFTCLVQVGSGTSLPSFHTRVSSMTLQIVVARENRRPLTSTRCAGCLLHILGRIADLYRCKWTFTNSKCAFMGIFGLGCGFANDEITLDILRGVQEIGEAACIPAGLGAPVGGAIGLAIGGVLTQLTAQTWRSTFWFLTGLSAVCCIGAIISNDEDAASHQLVDRRVDWLGAFLVTAGLTLIIFVLSDGSIAPNGWKTGCAHRGLFRILAVTIWSRAQGKLAVVLGIAFLEWCSFNSWTFWVQLYYQDYAALNPVLTMVRLLPMSVTGVLCNVLVALVVGHLPVVFLIAIGTLFTWLANLLFAVIDPAAPYWAFGFPAAILSVFGADFVFATGTLFVAKVCLPHEQSVGGALFQTLTQVGTAFGIALSTIVFDATLARSSAEYGVRVGRTGSGAAADAPRGAQLVAYKDAMWTGCAFGFAGALLAGVFLRSVGVVGHREKREEDAGSEVTAADRGEAAEVTARA
ncbi:MFS general substrate transporter [Trametes sanguinea]|nr:MFS general substrate transporter [Trametes sanguinea]